MKATGRVGNVFLTRLLPEGPVRRLQERTHLSFNPEDRPVTRDELMAGVRQADGVLCLVTDRIDDELMANAPRLKIISNYAVGYENIDVEAATRRGIAVTNTPDVLTDATADMAFALLLAVSRRVVEGDSLVRSGKWPGWGPMQLLGGTVTGATLGLIGFGRIGRAVAKRARAFDMRVLYWNRTRLSPNEEQRLGVAYAPLNDVLERSRFVSLHVAAAPGTRHLIDERALRLLGPTGYLINTARGTVVDEQALVRALREGVIAGAGLDVYENEPALAPGLADCPNVVLAPHLGSATLETRTAMGELAVDNLLAGLRGEVPRNVLNPEIYREPESP